MANVMIFPNTVDEFMDQYKIVDTEQVYTNGIELVPIFRMKQWFEERELDEWCTDCKEYNKEKNCCPRYNSVIREAIAEQKTGRWIPLRKEGCYKCSECLAASRVDNVIPQLYWNYCPRCGADMRGEQDG